MSIYPRNGKKFNYWEDVFFKLSFISPMLWEVFTISCPYIDVGFPNGLNDIYLRCQYDSFYFQDDPTYAEVTAFFILYRRKMRYGNIMQLKYHHIDTMSIGFYVVVLVLSEAETRNCL